MEAQAQQDIRALFLKEFFKRAIISSLNKYTTSAKGEDLFEKLDQVSQPQQLPVLEIKIPEEGKATSEETEGVIDKVQPSIQPQPAPIIQPPIQPVPLVKPAMPARQMPQIPAAPVMPLVPPRAPTRIMDRVNIILADPSVQLINCPGPDKKLMITRIGAVQPINLSFNSQEINDFLKEISERTKIPLTAGLFKVVFQNIIVTAVVSEFIGSKFVIERRPMQLAPIYAQIPTRAQFR